MATLNYKTKKTNAILKLTDVIQASFPALYVHLDEAPLHLSSGLGSISQMELDDYYQSLKDQATGFILSRNWL
ncbi:MAG: hypothetical protein IT236_15340 [Bacteroidia bacterium]|nr:hypothetical protein [Bacteroidia bacterium]